MKRKSQIRMGESVAILFVFFILLVAGFIFYSKIETRNIKSEKVEAENLIAIEVAQKVSFLPEILCSSENVITHNCFDIFKVLAFQGIAEQNRLYYFDILGRSIVTIKPIYPYNTTEIVLYNNSGGNWSRKLVTQIPITLYNATGEPQVNEKPYHSFAMMTVSVFV